MLADKLAIRTSDSDAAGIAMQIIRVVRPDIHSKIQQIEIDKISSSADSRLIQKLQA